jgi:transposase
LHKHPYGEDISSQRSSYLFALITEDDKIRFFKLQGRRREENEYWAYDITSISSYSEHLKQVQWGYNRDNDNLAQLNLALVYGDKSGLPFYYRKLAGNIPDSKTIPTLLSDLSDIGFTKIKLVADRGNYTLENVNNLIKANVNFLVGIIASHSYVKKEIDSVYEQIRSFNNFNIDYNLYGLSIPIKWEYKEQQSSKNDMVKSKKELNIHLYFNNEKYNEDENKLNKKLDTLRKELLSNKLVDKHKKDYEKYFEVQKIDGKITQVLVKGEAVKEKQRYFGYFALLSDIEDDVWEALHIYRRKDIAEKAFENIKDRLNMRRTLVSSELSLDGKLFVEFIALILISYINNQMKKMNVYKDYTMQQMLDKLDIIEAFEYGGKSLRVGEILDKQKLIFENLEIDIP